MVSLGLDFAIGWGINRFATNIVSKSAFSVLKKGFKEIYLESRTKKAVSKFVKTSKKVTSNIAKRFNSQFSKIMNQLERSPLYKLSSVLKKSEKQVLKKKMKTLAKKRIVTFLTDKFTTYINNILGYGAIDCLLSLGGFLAGALELKVDGNLDGKIEF